MIDENTLPEHLDAAVSGASIDLHRLTEVARHDGRRLRRRQRATSIATTTLLTAGVVVGFGWLSADDRPGSLPVPERPPAASPTPTIDADMPVAATGRATAAALAERVAELADGRATGFSGQHTRPGALARGLPLVTLGALRWTPDGASGSVPVRVTVQDGWGPADASVFTCDDPARLACTVDEADGRVVVGYEKHRGAATDRFADVWLRDQGLRVQVATSDARRIGTDPMVVLPHPPLSLDDLRSIALDPVWGPTIPSRYDDAGRDLTSYDETALP